MFFPLSTADVRSLLFFAGYCLRSLTITNFPLTITNFLLYPNNNNDNDNDNSNDNNNNYNNNNNSNK